MASKATDVKGEPKPAKPAAPDTTPASASAKPADTGVDASVSPKAPEPKPVAARPVAKAKPARKSVVAKASARKRPVKAPVKTAAAKPTNQIIKAAKSVITTAARTAARTAQKEKTVMATAFEMPKFEAPKLFADFNDRAKAAVEKGQKAFADANDMTKGNVEALVESGKIAAKGFETLGQDAAEYGRKSFESLTAMLKSAASVKSPTDFFKLQSDYVRQSFDAAVAQGSKSTEAFIKLASDASQPVQNRFSVVADKVKSAA